MTDAQFYIYNVGHGVCTLLTGRKDGSLYRGVFDCGTKWGHDLCDMDAVIKDMKDKILADGADHIDEIVISHQDEDHWNKLLELFFSLNDIEGNYKDIAFGTPGKRAWMLNNQNGGKNLYSFTGNSFTKKRYTDSYGYTVTAEYDGEYLISFSLEIIDMNRLERGEAPQYSVVLSNVKGKSFTVELNMIVENAAIKVKEELRLRTILNAAQNYIRTCRRERGYYFVYELVLAALSDVYLTFTENYLDSLVDKFKKMNKKIKIPIKKVIMGGDRITKGYFRLKELLKDMVEYYGEEYNGFLRAQDGAYIIMDGYNPVVKMNNFPNKVIINGIRITCFTNEVLRNLTSAAVQFNIGRDDILLLPGDVTVHGFKTIRERLRDKEEVRPGALKLLLAPHHGSDNTNFLYERDKKTLFDDQPIFYLLDVISIMHEQCNLVISGYNKSFEHPGEKFTLVAITELGSGRTEHSFAYARALLKGISTVTRDDIRNSIEIVSKSERRIFTTNVLPFCDNNCNHLYYKYCNGEIALDPNRSNTIPGLKRVRPPDDSFI